MFKKEERDLASLFDQAADSEEPVPPAPEHEFQSILDEMKRRKIKPRIRKELKKKK